MKRKRHNQQTWSEAGTEVPDVDNSPLIHEEHNNLCLSLGDGIVEDKLKSIKQWFGRKIKPRELEKIGDFCDLYECLYDRGIIDLGEYKELSKALNAVGLQRLDKEIKKTSETIRKIRIKKRNSSGSKRKGSVQKANVKRDWKSARRKWDRIGAELLDRRANKLLKRNFEEMGIFFYGMDKVMNSKDVDVKLNICSRVTGGVNKILDKIFTDTALTNARDLKKATCVFVDNYGASVIIAARGCLRLTLRFTTRSALEMMWDDYLSGDLSNMLTDDIVTIPMKEMAGWEEIFVGVKIDKAQYLNVCRSLPNGINPVTGETSQVQTDGWWRRQQHFSPDWKQDHAEANSEMNRPLSFFPGNANEDKFDTNEEIISCIQNMIKTSVHTSHFRYHIDMICACADDTKEDDENGDCFKSETSKLPSEEPAKCEPKYQNRGTNHLTIKWESATGEVQTYGVDLIVKDEIVRSKNNLRDSSTEVTFDELLPGTEYDVIIHTVTDSADTQSYPLRVCAGPEEIVGCEITHLSNRCLQLSWQRPQRHVNYFQVFYWPSGKSCSSKCEETRETLIVLSDLDPDTSYEARITTVSKERTSKHYHITFATDPGVPLGFTRIYRGLNSVNVKWNKPKGLFDHFIARWRLQDEEETNETRDTTKTQHIVPGLSSGIQYEVCVSSVSNGKENEPCSIDVQTESATITAIDIEPGVYSLKLKWKMSEGRVDRYQVQFYGPKGPQERMMCPTRKTTLQKQLTLPSHLPCEITREAYLFVPGAEQGGDAGNNQYILTDACWTRSKEWIVKFNSQELYLHRGHKIWEINLWELMTRNVQQKRSDTVGRKEALKRNQRHLTTNETGLVISMGCYGEKAKRTKTSF